MTVDGRLAERDKEGKPVWEFEDALGGKRGGGLIDIFVASGKDQMDI